MSNLLDTSLDIKSSKNTVSTCAVRGNQYEILRLIALHLCGTTSVIEDDDVDNESRSSSLGYYYQLQYLSWIHCFEFTARGQGGGKLDELRDDEP